jgi:DNA-directed RNA polymerase subunit RPC12/RpoP
MSGWMTYELVCLRCGRRMDVFRCPRPSVLMDVQCVGCGRSGNCVELVDGLVIVIERERREPVQ